MVELQGEIDKFIIVIRDSSILLFGTDESVDKKPSRDTKWLYKIVYDHDLMDMYVSASNHLFWYALNITRMRTYLVHDESFNTFQGFGNTVISDHNII